MSTTISKISASNISAFKIANKLITGQAAIEQLAAELTRLNVNNPLIVTDAILVKSGTVDLAPGIGAREALEQVVRASVPRLEASGLVQEAEARGVPPYDALIVASRDWHHADHDNGGHFADGEPDYIDTWPVHCVADTHGAEYDPGLDTGSVTHHVKKGQGIPAYSLFEGTTDAGESVAELLTTHGVVDVDIVGLATDHCVRATALDAVRAGFGTTVLLGLTAGISAATVTPALEQLRAAGVVLVGDPVVGG